VTRSLSGRRVLIIVENLPVPFDRRVWLEAQALRDAGCAVTVICPKMKGYTAGHEVIDGITVHRHPLPFEADRGFLGFVAEYGVAFLCEFFLAWRVFLTRGFDVLHACNPPDNIFLIALAFRPFGVRFVYDQHDINPELYDAKYGRRDLLYRAVCWFERMSYRAAHLVIATNESYRAIALGRGGKKPDLVHVVRSAPDTAKFRPVEPNPALKRGRALMVAYLGVMGRQEGVDLLLEAVGHIVNRMGRKDVWFTLIGSGPERPALERRADELCLRDHLEFTGRIPDTDLLRHLSTADVCVNPDRVNAMNDKSTMNKIMEYMAVGKPIVQFEMTEGRHSAQDASLYAKPNDPEDFAEKICQLLDDPAARERMGTFGMERMRTALDWRFSRDALVRAYASLWDAG
jgi:glycosyltransferase involved in cell wall biosynthesis